MRNLKPLLVVMGLLCLLLPRQSLAQTQNEQNLKKYWENRDRLRKYMVKIGPLQGESIPIRQRDRQTNSVIWSDATSYMGYYIAVLASEYKLLKDANKSTTATENELFFCY